MLSNITIKNLGSGVILFENIVSPKECGELIPYLRSLKQKAVLEDYTIIKDENGQNVYAINRSGHRYAIEDIETSSSHIMNFLDNNESKEIELFFEECERAFQRALMEYVTLYPMVLPSIWWRTPAHVLAYGPNSDMGLHSDNDINYQPGFEPDLQVATRSVLSAIMYFNDSVKTKDEIIENEYVGGEIEFIYLGIKYAPKAGDLLMFPSNFLACHEVKKNLYGERYAYVGYYSHGSAQPDRGITINSEGLLLGRQGQVWMPNVVVDYLKFLEEKYPDKDEVFLANKLFPTRRLYNSTNTQKEVEYDKQRS